jgi:hypothetical protein
MADPPDPRRKGELWNQDRIDAQRAEIEPVRDLVVLSGGWAWHFLSPADHREYKQQHDHKDVDLFVTPGDFDSLRTRLIERGFKRVRTQHDNPSGNFYRFTKAEGGSVGKVVFDVFLEEVPSIEVRGFRVVEPRTLLSFYPVRHTSDECVAVRAAKRLVARGISPVGRAELIF